MNSEKFMQSNILSRPELLIIVLIGCVLSVAFLLYPVPKGSIQSSGLFIENTAPPPKQKQTMRLNIPGINVDAAVEHVGITPDGAMAEPKNPHDVAWFKLGPRPGENGSAVIAGHYGLNNGKASVFDNLYKLRKGDKLYVEDAEGGVIISFVVRESRTYDPKADASNVFGSNDGKPHLNLITCIGAWNEASKSYPERLVVFTDTLKNE